MAAEKARVLLVEDERLVLHLLAKGLRDEGYQVLEAEDGASGKALCRERSPDIALLDIRMEGMSGLELAAWMKRETEIPFLFLTAYDEPDLVQQATHLGAYGYLVKPLDTGQIIPALESALAVASECKRLRVEEEGLMSALEDSRTVNLAVGLAMARLGVRQDQAFEALRRHARNSRRSLREVAQAYAVDPQAIDLRACLKQ